MADGTTKSIKDVEVGDSVWAKDPVTGKEGPRRVTATIIGQGKKRLTEIGVNGRSVIATDGHLLWIDDQRRWVDAENLESGDSLLSSNGRSVKVDVVSSQAKVVTVHNLTVNGIHTFFVLIGRAPVLVHNCASLDDLIATAHGRQRLAEFGFDDVSIRMMRASANVYEQANGAQVYVSQVGDDLFDMIVTGERGIITAHRGYTRADLDALAHNYQWTGYP
jgi:pretoxin HINT domain-containing protein